MLENASREGGDRASAQDQTRDAQHDPSQLELIAIEVQPDPHRQGDVGPSDMIEKFSRRVDEVGAGIASVASRLRQALESRLRDEDAADRWQMSHIVAEFGINLEAQTGLVIAQGKTGATFKVAITWQGRADK